MAFGLMFAGVCTPLRAAGQETATDDSALVVLNREIVVLRSTIAGAAPAVRVERALQRLRALPPSALDEPLHALPFTLGDVRGQQILLGNRVLLSLAEGDVEPEAQREGLDPLVQRTLRRLEEARTAWHASKDGPLLWQGVGRVLLVSAAAALLAWLVVSGTRRGVRALVAGSAEWVGAGGTLRWRDLAMRLAGRSLRLVQWAVLAVLAYAWLRVALGSFPLTEPLAGRLGDWLIEQLLWLLRAVGHGLPNLVTVVIVVVLTRGVADVVGYFFDAARRGRLPLAALHPETVPATQRIVVGVVWAIGLALAYPYLPGAQSDAFKGISVLLGLMITLGSGGIVTQAMSGLVLIYSRALRKGDFVEVGEVQGVVTEVAPLAIKLLNLRNEEVTIPNTVLVSSPIRNFSRLSGQQGTLVSTRVSIGYDTPWREVYALLEAAARATPGVRGQPPPKVFQRALDDFYAQYELMVGIDAPLDRIDLLSRLHEHIRDGFAAAGVQILSPHHIALHQGAETKESSTS
jgi:small-conductance mechanosensitive channel